MRAGQRLTTLASVIFLIIASFSPPTVAEFSAQCKAWLVQSIPTDMPHLRPVPGVLSTGSNLSLLFSFPFPPNCLASEKGGKKKKKRLFNISWFFLLCAADVLRWLAGNSSHRLDIIAQYWQLVASPKDPRSGDYGFSDKDMLRFGADQGALVYQALENAADRNVTIRSCFLFQTINSSFGRLNRKFRI